MYLYYMVCPPTKFTQCCKVRGHLIILYLVICGICCLTDPPVQHTKQPVLQTALSVLYETCLLLNEVGILSQTRWMSKLRAMSVLQILTVSFNIALLVITHTSKQRIISDPIGKYCTKQSSPSEKDDSSIHCALFRISIYGKTLIKRSGLIEVLS